LASVRKQLNDAAKRVKPAGRAAAEKVAQPLREAIAKDPVYGPLAQQVKVHDQDGNLVIEAKGEAGSYLMDFEIGTETTPPSGAFFFAAREHRTEAEAEFRRQLLGAK
jgi:hypothetical protein